MTNPQVYFIQAMQDLQDQDMQPNTYNKKPYPYTLLNAIKKTNYQPHFSITQKYLNSKKKKKF